AALRNVPDALRGRADLPRRVVRGPGRARGGAGRVRGNAARAGDRVARPPRRPAPPPGSSRRGGRLFARAEPHPLARLGQTALALDRGDARAAVDGAAWFLRRHAGERRTEHAAALELLVRAQAALGRLDEAGAH